MANPYAGIMYAGQAMGKGLSDYFEGYAKGKSDNEAVTSQLERLQGRAMSVLRSGAVADETSEEGVLLSSLEKFHDKGLSQKKALLVDVLSYLDRREAEEDSLRKRHLMDLQGQVAQQQIDRNKGVMGERDALNAINLGLFDPGKIKQEKEAAAMFPEISNLSDEDKAAARGALKSMGGKALDVVRSLHQFLPPRQDGPVGQDGIPQGPADLPPAVPPPIPPPGLPPVPPPDGLQYKWDDERNIGDHLDRFIEPARKLNPLYIPWELTKAGYQLLKNKGVQEKAVPKKEADINNAILGFKPDQGGSMPKLYGPEKLEGLEKAAADAIRTLRRANKTGQEANELLRGLGANRNQPVPANVPVPARETEPEQQPTWRDAYNWQLAELRKAGHRISPAVAQEVERRAKLQFPPVPKINMVSKGGMNILLVDGQYKAAMPAPAKKGAVRFDAIRIPDTNMVQPVQIGADGAMTPMGSAQNMSSGEIDREFKVDILGPNAYTMNKESAKLLRQQVADVGFANESIGQLLEISNLPGEEYDIEKWGDAAVMVTSLKGRLRLSLVGPGAVSAEEWKMMDETIPNPTDILKWEKQERAALRTLKSKLNSVLRREAAAHIEGGIDNVSFPEWMSGASNTPQFIRVQHPDGRIGTIPAGQLEAAEKQGFKRVR